MQILPIGLSSLASPLSTGAASAVPAGGSSFEGILGQTLQGLSTVQNTADQQAVSLATGRNVSLVDSMLSMEQASLNFKMVMQVRDKALEAYQDVMRTQV